MKNLKKTLVMCVSLALIAALAIGGTVAYLTLDTPNKSNIFSVGDISIILDEKVDGTKGAAEVEKTDAGATYSNVMPGDYLQKEVSVENNGANPAYVAVEVTFNNALAINKAIDEVYEGKDYNEAQIQSMYDYIFDGFGMNYTKVYADGSKTDMRLTITGDDMPEGVMQVDSVKTIDEYVLVHSGNWFAEGDTVIKADGFKGYYSTGMDKYQLRYTYYMHLDPEQKVTLFKGFNVPASFNAEQLKMFQDMNIDIVATAIQANNIGGDSEEAKAKNAFTALKKEYADGEGNDGDIGDYYVVATAEELADALEMGGRVSLAGDIQLTKSLEVGAGKNVTLNLNGNAITSTTTAIINNGTITISNGKLENNTINGAATINNKGTMVLDGVEIVGAPIGATAEKYPAYAVLSSGNLVIEEGTVITSDRGALSLSGTGETVINGGTFASNDVNITGNYTSHVILVNYGAANQLTINGGTFEHRYAATSGGVVVNNWSATTVNVNGGNFSGGNYFGKWDNLSDYGYGSTKTPFSVKGGTFTGIDTNYVAPGYEATKNADNTYTVSMSQKTVNEMFADAENGDTVTLSAGTYKIPSSVNNKELTIKGTKDTKIDVSSLTYINGSNITFDGVTIKSTPGTGYNYGFADAEYTVFNNCTIEGSLGLDYSCEFNNCVFNISGNNYNIWTWGAGTATFNGCTFNCDGKAMLVYANVLDNGTTHQTVNINNCVFNDNGDDTVTGKAAIEITNTYTPVRTYDVIINNTTVNGFAQTVPGAGDFNAAYGSVAGSDIGTNVWGNKCELPNTQINVVIDGVDVY